MNPRLALASLALSGCATAGDVRRIEVTVERLEQVVREKTATPEDVAAALTVAKAEIRTVAEEIEARPVRVVERSVSVVDAILSPSGAVAGALSLASAVGTHLYRNRQRRRRGERVK